MKYQFYFLFCLLSLVSSLKEDKIKILMDELKDVDENIQKRYSTNMNQ